jgi:hypothetical protein
MPDPPPQQIWSFCKGGLKLEAEPPAAGVKENSKKGLDDWPACQESQIVSRSKAVGRNKSAKKVTKEGTKRAKRR